MVDVRVRVDRLWRRDKAFPEVRVSFLQFVYMLGSAFAAIS